MKRVLPKKGPKAGALTEAQTEYLIGHHFGGEGKLFDTEEEARAAWFEHRDELMARRDGEWSATRYRSGSRPRGWWMFEAPEPRRQIKWPPVKALTPEMYRGMPKLTETDDRDFYETEFEYLKRLGLLFPGERDLESIA